MINTRILSVSAPIFLCLISAFLPLCDTITAYIFSLGDLNNIFVFSVLFIVLLHMQLCMFIFLCLNYSCHEAEVFPELSNCDSQLGRYPAGQIGLRYPVGPVPYLDLESKPATFKTEIKLYASPCNIQSVDQTEL